MKGRGTGEKKQEKEGDTRIKTLEKKTCSILLGAITTIFAITMMSCFENLDWNFK